MDQHVDTKPEDNLDAEEHNDTDVGQGNRQEDGKSDSDPTDDLEDEQVDESDDDWAVFVGWYRDFDVADVFNNVDYGTYNVWTTLL